MSDAKILFNNDARQKIFEGVQEVCDAVASTLGPKGHCVIIDRGGYAIPHITKDGVTVARAYDTEDPVKRIGATLVKTVAAKTCDEAGDGTTTATILTTALMKVGMEKMALVKSPQQFRLGMEAAKDAAIDFLNTISTQIDGHDFARVEQIANISANGDAEVAAIVTEAIGKVGNDGVITVEESTKGETTIEVTTGFQYEKGITNPYFITNPERLECVLENPYVLIFGKGINYVQEILPIVQTVYTAKRALLIVAPNVSNDVMKFLITNVQKDGGLKACFVKAPGYGQVQKDMLEDMSVKMGAEIIGDEFGHPIEQAGMSTDWLGECDRVVVSTTRTMIVGGAGTDAAIKSRIESIKHMISTTTNAYDIEKCRERISKLTGGAAVVYVGANSEVEMKERKDRIDDAIAATRAALEEGYVPGGGTTHYRMAKYINNWLKDNLINTDYAFGAEVVMEALTYPFKQLCLNSDLNPDKMEVLIEHEPINIGINYTTAKAEDMIATGIIDPAKVARVSLENSVSVAVQFLNASCVMSIIEKK